MYFLNIGGMAEWFMAHAWKACWGSRPSGVQIPLPPPQLMKFKVPNISIIDAHHLCHHHLILFFFHLSKWFCFY